MCGFNVYEKTTPEGTFVVIDGIQHDDDCTGCLLSVDFKGGGNWDAWAAAELFNNPELFE